MAKREHDAALYDESHPHLYRDEDYRTPLTRYFKTKDEFDEAVGESYIFHANKTCKAGSVFITGLSHGLSPAGVYQYILDHFEDIKNPDCIYFTFVNSQLKRQQELEDVMDARTFLITLLKMGLISKKQIIGERYDPEDPERYVAEYNKKCGSFLKKHKKEGLDFAILAADPTGRVAGISRNSEAFDSTEIGVVTNDEGVVALTATPHFLIKTDRIAFLATKADKRRPLAWLYYPWAKTDESPGFLRHIDKVEERLMVFIDNDALTWPQITLERKSSHGTSRIRMDLAKPYEEFGGEKLPVILMIHGFLGLNSFDGLLTAIPTHQYIGAAMHYGSIPQKLPPSLYSRHIVNNIDAAVSYFGKLGHPVYIFDHSMGNIYFLMMDKYLDELKGIKKYLCGRLGANPFFGIETRHALLGFFDNVILPSFNSSSSAIVKAVFTTARKLLPIDSKKGVRKRGIFLSEWLIRKDSLLRERVWRRAKARILYLMSNMDSLPHLNKIPIERALSRLPAKVFVIQVYSALLESEAFDDTLALENIDKQGIPVTIIKSDRDGVAKYVPQVYEHSAREVIDVTNQGETDYFREHLYHMVNPKWTSEIINEFVEQVEKERKKAAS